MSERVYTPLYPEGPATPMAQQILEHRSLLQRAMGLPWIVKLIATVFGLGFLAANAAIGFLIIDGRLDGEWYDIRDLGYGVERLRLELDDLDAGPWLSYWVTALLGALGILSFVGGVLLIGSWVERRLLAKFQIRQGPNRVGPFGLLQPLADAFKLMQKEVLIPLGADRFLFYLPPILIFIPAMLGWGPVPWAENMTYLDINVGLVYVIAISSLAVIAVFLAGWSSNNHYALLGGMRTVAMMVSYEIPISIALLAVVLLTGSLQLSEIVAWQSTHNAWLGLLLPLPLFTFFFASTAEINRTPNDIGEAESEIVAGFHTEYSGMKAGLFLAVELGNAMLIGALVGTFFLGGYTLFGLEEWIPGYLILFAKISSIYFLLVWLRGTLPRFRLDQLMGFAWKFLIPLSILQVLVVAAEVSVISRTDFEGVVELGAVGVINLVVTVVSVRLLAEALGYNPRSGALQRPRLTREIGGLRAARTLRAGS
jgi:NADH-quinone oxidoreductase subunit H